MKKLLKWLLAFVFVMALILFAFGYWFMGLADRPYDPTDAYRAGPHSLPYLTEGKMPQRGKILAIVTSTATMGSSGKSTGYELTELSRAYYVFQANGFEVDVASPLGGKPPVIIDDEDMGIYDFAFLNDPEAQRKVNNTLPIAEVDASLYDAVYFVGGKGAMYDFPENAHVQAIVKSYFQSGKVIGAVCHGPAAFVNVILNDGQHLLKDRPVCGFTNDEELFLIPGAAGFFPFLLEDELKRQGANFVEGAMYLENVIHDGKIVTGQNPWSTWKLAETMIRQMGYEPKKRIATQEENTIAVLKRFEAEGYRAAKETIGNMGEKGTEIDRMLLAMHCVVKAMQWEVGKSAQLFGLLRYAKKQADEFEAK